MQTTANYGLKKPEGNDTVDIDVINGNMDSIDGELSKRAPGGYGLGTMAVDISNQDLNNYNTTGFFRGSSMTNAPTSDWYYVEVVGHDEKWTLQIATNYFNNNMYYRRKNNGTWQGWVRITNTADIPSSLPASGGNSTTVGGFSASGTPSTTEKSNLIGMVNELFQSASSGKSAIATAAGSPSMSSETFTQLATDIINGKNNIYDAIVGKGTVPASKNFLDLVTGVQNIKMGYGVGDVLEYCNATVLPIGSDVWAKNYRENSSTVVSNELIDGNNNLIVITVPFNNITIKIKKYNVDTGNLIWSMDTGLRYISDICLSQLDSDNNIYLYHQGAMHKYNTDGKLLYCKGSPSICEFIIANNYIYATDTNNTSSATNTTCIFYKYDLDFNLITSNNSICHLYYCSGPIVNGFPNIETENCNIIGCSNKYLYIRDVRQCKWCGTTLGLTYEIYQLDLDLNIKQNMGDTSKRNYSNDNIIHYIDPSSNSLFKINMTTDWIDILKLDDFPACSITESVSLDASLNNDIQRTSITGDIYLDNNRDLYIKANNNTLYKYYRLSKKQDSIVLPYGFDKVTFDKNNFMYVVDYNEVTHKVRTQPGYQIAK